MFPVNDLTNPSGFIKTNVCCTVIFVSGSVDVFCSILLLLASCLVSACFFRILKSKNTVFLHLSARIFCLSQAICYSRKKCTLPFNPNLSRISAIFLPPSQSPLTLKYPLFEWDLEHSSLKPYSGHDLPKSCILPV